MKNKNTLIVSILLVSNFLFISGFVQTEDPCTAQPYVDIPDAEAFAQDAELPFRFPLDDATSDPDIESAIFCTASSGPVKSRKYHAAEDYFQPPGTPVYAIADGEISFSGPMGGYGWLIIIDHPQANLYSLYGHLSPSRWYRDAGPVSKGDLIAYLGDDDENGGSRKNPLIPHLHLGIRAGQRSDYPAKSDWRWMAGWIKLCPAEIGWLRPSEVIAGQKTPEGGYPMPEMDFLALWGVEILFGLFYIAGGFGVFILATRKKKPIWLVMGGAMCGIAGFLFNKDDWKISPLLFILSAFLLIYGIMQFKRRSQATE